MENNQFIKAISIKGFKSIKELSLPLKKVNILIGENGIGKTNFISAFELLRAIYDKDLQTYVLLKGGANSLLYMGRKQTPDISLELEIEHDSKLNRFGVLLRESQDRLIIDRTYTSYYFAPTWHQQICDKDVLEASIKDDRSGQAYYVSPLLNRFEVYHFHDTGDHSPIKGVKNLDDNIKLHRDGSNLAPFLYFLKERAPKNFSLIEHAVASIAPFFKSFLLTPDRLAQNKIRLEWLHTFMGDTPMNEWQLSDGTLRFICLATLLLQPNPPQTIIIDEPELGLHPQAINVLSSLIKKASDKSQIIVTTQSVGLIDNFSPEDIIVLNRDGANTSFKRLQADELDAWADEYSIGEMWEMNIFGGQPL